MTASAEAVGRVAHWLTGLLGSTFAFSSTPFFFFGEIGGQRETFNILLS